MGDGLNLPVGLGSIAGGDLYKLCPPFVLLPLRGLHAERSGGAD